MKSSELLALASTMNHKNIIFDMTGVILHPRKQVLAQQIGYWRIIWYCITHFKSPLNLKNLFFDLLYKISPLASGRTIYYRKKALPPIICDWLTGMVNSKQVLEMIQASLKSNVTLSSQESYLINSMAQTIFSPTKEIIRQSMRPIEQIVQVIKQLKNKCDHNGKPMHKLYVLSNVDRDSFHMIKHVFPDIFNQFDGLVLSGDVGFIKPYPKIYEYFLKKFDLDPAECFFIDDQAENIIGAQEVGIEGVQFVEY